MLGRFKTKEVTAMFVKKQITPVTKSLRLAKMTSFQNQAAGSSPRAQS